MFLQQEISTISCFVTGNSIPFPLCIFAVNLFLLQLLSILSPILFLLFWSWIWFVNLSFDIWLMLDFDCLRSCFFHSFLNLVCSILSTHVLDRVYPRNLNTWTLKEWVQRKLDKMSRQTLEYVEIRDFVVVRHRKTCCGIRTRKRIGICCNKRIDKQGWGFHLTLRLQRLSDTLERLQHWRRLKENECVFVCILCRLWIELQVN